MVKTIVLVVILLSCAAYTFAASDQNTATNFVYPAEETDINDLTFYEPSAEIGRYPVIEGPTVKNIIIMIGDGMGLAQTTLARIKTLGIDGRLNMEKLPFTAIINTHSANSIVTESAAAASAYATGFKTNNGSISVAPDGKKCLTILEAAQNKKMATGIITTVGISEATPAAFAAHVESRTMKVDIAKQMLDHRVNVLFGDSLADKSKKDLLAQAQKLGYEYIKDEDGLKKATGPYVLGLFPLDCPKSRNGCITSAQITEKAIEILNKQQKGLLKEKSGFILVVEGGRIDWGCHNNNANTMTKQLLLFDQAVKVAADFANKDKQTLLLVFADHETGGLTILSGDPEKKNPEIGWSTKSHTASPIVLYAFGPKADTFTGVLENTDVPKKIAALLGIKPFPRKMD